MTSSDAGRGCVACGNSPNVPDALRRGHDRIHQVRGQPHFAIAQLVEQVFGQVAQRHELGGVQETRAALDRVKSPKDVVQQATVVRHSLKIDELVIHV